MQIRLFTIGFTKKTAEQFFALLAGAGVRKVIDTRENRGGQLAGFAKEEDLRYFLPRLIGVEYEVEPLFAPTKEIRRAYMASGDWAAYEQSFLQLVLDRRLLDRIPPERFAEPAALLCSEPTAERCHRRLLVEHLAESWRGLDHQVEIEHLVLPGTRGSGRPRRRQT
jgi:uncharacterized protein (DUF488 family)